MSRTGVAARRTGVPWIVGAAYVLTGVYLYRRGFVSVRICFGVDPSQRVSVAARVNSGYMVYVSFGRWAVLVVSTWLTGFLPYSFVLC